MKAKLRDDVAEFDRAVETAERARAIQSDERMMEYQSHLVNFAHQSVSPIQKNMPLLEFPVRFIDISENPNFFGRDRELKKLYTWLVESHTEVGIIPCGIHGFGGIGKTETALYFAYKYTERFDAIFWVSADTEHGTETLRTFGNIGRKLRLFDSGTISDSQVDVVREWLQNEGICHLHSVF